MTTDDLKPCPWCGGEADAPDGPYGRPVWVYEARCTVCHALGAQADTKADVVNAWNCRPVEDALRARAEAAETEARDACTAADEAEHRASLAIDSAQELARCVLQATQPKGSWVDHPPMGDWAGVVDGVSALRARAEAAEARAAQAGADARTLLGVVYGVGVDMGLAIVEDMYDHGMSEDEDRMCNSLAEECAIDDSGALLAVVRRILAGVQP